METSGHAREAGKDQEDCRVMFSPDTHVPFWCRTMTAAHGLEMKVENVGRDVEGVLEEEEKMREDGEGEDPFKNKKVHKIVSKWMLPENARRTYLERANCLPPPVFIISISLAEVSMWGGEH